MSRIAPALGVVLLLGAIPVLAGAQPATSEAAPPAHATSPAVPQDEAVPTPSPPVPAPVVPEAETDDEPDTTGPLPEATGGTLELDEPTDDDSLEEFLQDAPDIKSEEGKLSLYGFADFGFRKLFMPERSSLLLTLPGKSTFMIGNLNLYLRAHPAPRWTSLVEIRFTFLPNGGQSATIGLGDEPTNAQYFDYADPVGTISVGGTVIERAWLEYAITPKLQIRVGRWLTPYGIWNIDHGSPTVLGVRRPFLVASQHIPEAQTGLQLLGTVDAGEYKLRYFATLSNGRGPAEEYAEANENKAVGLSFKLETPWLDEFTFGGASYMGRNTDAWQQGRLTDPSDVQSLEAITIVNEEKDELSLGIDLKLRWKRVLFQLEALADQRRYSARGRPPHLAAPGALQPDYTELAAYAIFGYELDYMGTVLWTANEYTNSQQYGAQVYLNSVGVTLRPVPSVTLKAALGHLKITRRGEGPSLLPFESLTDIELQAAWVF